MEFTDSVGVTLINASASDDMVAMAAWVSHDADSEERLTHPDRVKKLIAFLMRNRHMSPFEHGVFTFKVDVPLFVAREFMRHRTASYNEVSGRYTEMKPRFYVGDRARVQKGNPGAYYFEDGSDEQTAIYKQNKRKAVKKAWKTYEANLGAGIAKEQAREELPLSLMTQFYVTMNPRNLMQFLTLRNDKHALKEIRDVAVKMEEIFAETMPFTYEAYAKSKEKANVDPDKLQAEILRLQREVNSLTNKRQEALRDSTYWKKKYEEADEQRLGLINDYNKLFVAMHDEEDARAKEAKGPDDDTVFKAGGYLGPNPYPDGHLRNVPDDKIKQGDLTGETFDIKNIDSIINKGCDYIIPHAAEAAERLKPIYNVYVNPDVDKKDIFQMVLSELNKKRRGNK